MTVGVLVQSVYENTDPVLAVVSAVVQTYAIYIILNGFGSIVVDWRW